MTSQLQKKGTDAKPQKIEKHSGAEGFLGQTFSSRIQF